MRSLGLTATEFGPDGYLSAALLGAHGMSAAGRFVPVLLHEPGADPVGGVERVLDGFSEGAVLVLAAATGQEGYEGRPALDAAGWELLLASLDRCAAAAAARGFTATLHPHVGTMVAERDEVVRVLDGSGVSLCLDTGHLLIGGTDPAALASGYASRIGHVHLKDVRARVAGQVRNGEISYTDGVRTGLYQPLGQGDVDLAGVIGALSGVGYRGWYVLEQDTILSGPDASPVEQVAESLGYLGTLP